LISAWKANVSVSEAMATGESFPPEREEREREREDGCASEEATRV
jgi:magnesium-transporting ATPase (P-type)